MLERDEIRKAIAEANGDIVVAAATIGVSKPTLYRWIRRRGMRDEIWRTHGKSPCANGQERRPNLTGDTVQYRATHYARKNGVRLPVVTAQSEQEGGERFLSLSSPSGDMVTVRFASVSEANKILGLYRSGKTYSSSDQEQSIVADIQVTSATSKERISRLVGAVQRVCDPSTARIILAAAEIK